MVEPVGTGEENSRLADVKLELAVSKFAATGKGFVCVFCHSRSSEKIWVHLRWVKGLHHLVRVDEADIAARSGQGVSTNWRFLLKTRSLTGAAALLDILQENSLMQGERKGDITEKILAVVFNVDGSRCCLPMKIRA